MKKNSSDLMVLVDLSKVKRKVFGIDEIDKLEEEIKVILFYNNGPRVGIFNLRELKSKIL